MTAKFSSLQFLFPLGRYRRYARYKGPALRLIQERLEHFNRNYQFRYNRVSVKRQRTRWGSCSKKGNLNFNFKIFFLPPRLADYIVVHELCHLREFNHSGRFWELVARTIPEYKKLAAEIKKIRLY